MARSRAAAWGEEQERALAEDTAMMRASSITIRSSGKKTQPIDHKRFHRLPLTLSSIDNEKFGPGLSERLVWFGAIRHLITHPRRENKCPTIFQLRV
jgi:hypothetical protein